MKPVFSHITIFPDAYKTSGRLLENVTATQLAKELAKPYAVKEEQQLIRLGKFENNSRASGSELESFCGVQLDYDDPAWTRRRIIASLRKAGLCADLYETWTQGRHRAFVPTDKPYPPDQLPSALATLEHAGITGFARESGTPKQGAFIGTPQGQLRKGQAISGAPLVVKPLATVTEIQPQRQAMLHAFTGIQARVKELGRPLQDGDGRWLLLQQCMGSLAARHAPGTMIEMMTAACAHPGYFHQPDMTASVIAAYVKRAVAIARKEDAKAPQSQDQSFWLGSLEPRPADWLVHGLVERGTIAMLYGEWNTYKTFTALDLALSVASGRGFLAKFKTSTTRAAYVAGEGRGGILRRIAGWQAQHGASSLALAAAPGRAVDAAWWVLLEDSLPEGTGLVVIDPLLANFGNGEPTRDGHLVIGHAKALIARTGCTLLLVHHVNLSDKVFGGVMLPSLADTLLKATRAGSGFVLQHEKAKDAEPWPAPIGIKPRVVEVPGLHENGKPVTTLVLEEDEALTLEGKTMTATRGRKGLQALIETYGLNAEQAEQAGLAARWFANLGRRFRRGDLGRLAEHMKLSETTVRSLLLGLSNEALGDRPSKRPPLWFLTKATGARSAMLFDLSSAGKDLASILARSERETTNEAC